MPGLYSYLNSHPDERKPPIPYAIGSQHTAIAYDPPKELLKNFYDWYRPAVDQVEDDLRNLPPVEACLRHLPAEGRRGTSSVQIRVLEHIRVTDRRNSQVVKVQASVVGSSGMSSSDSKYRRTHGGHSSMAMAPTCLPRPTAVVTAKLYDPLYVDFDDCHPDPFNNCDAAFALETEAYRDYLRPLYGVCVPHFYGSYTIDIPIPDDTRQCQSSLSPDQLKKSSCRTRPVRAILYEYIPGIALDKAMEDNLYSQSQRKEIMRALVTAESKMRQLDVLLDEDFYPRNVLVTSAEEGQPADIRLIDFGAAECGSRQKWEAHVPTTEPEPLSQIQKRWFDINVEWKDPSNLRHPFLDLVDWEWDEWLRHEYASPSQQRKP
ncbi:hypothetical protein N0V82_009499 [Gnomoniopsis sp. IMI 355080]|nr:hypothetical protein N0V82_009499 [Gnomoniopsis sp. IMI 355080]